MAGAVIENLSGRKLACLCSVLLVALLVCFLLGGLVAPEPSSSQNILGTICLDHEREPDRWFQVWSVIGSEKMCDKADKVDDLMDTGISSEQVVFAFQMPLRRGAVLDFTRWQQNLIGVLQLDIDHDSQYEMVPNATLALDVRLGYKNKEDKTEDWTLLAASVEERHLICDLDSEQSYRYNCDLIPLFELGSLHHDYYLLNLRLPPNMENQRNVGIGKLVDINLVAIFQNGGFTKVWVSLKTIFFPLVVVLLVWFWRRVQALQREPALIECMLFSLGICLSVLNLPLEFLTLRFDMPYMLLITDIRQGVFYAVLLSFWLVFAGEHLMVSEDCDRNRLAAYWKHLSAVACGCISLFIFDMCERGVQLTNPFYSIWGTRVGTNLALSFIIMAGVSASLYFCFLSWMIWRVFCNINVKRHSLPAMSSVRRLHYEGIIYRFKFLMLATLTCAAMTVIGFILGQVAEGQWKWDDEISLNYTSAILTGVYGMWNVYTMAVICLYAPSHKRWPTAAAAGGVAQLDSQSEEIEFSRLAPANDEPSDLTSLTQFVRKAATD
ncbi:Protein wntless [Amphibalanus amphitrite]|uniref:Protein wntless n=1 Tax=Amphibalanus amphitrite TaxID=1232801 RepID=A0A6A4V5Z1_AMPAM|nr:protein wntless-like [Amphibalanus amphitrite]XP_043221058.1 protein wntless-like [Amphibalanus amphitrite]XP_043221059.1 protein wntless-like [Amphibalanus amphitrite]XP_043221060.1 protein wntless-like [Amphibalanus amphitrite]XP_043221061.1 protein wntless-like [Amphibalanus amphitrite]KAF0287004.1 Protein wntless [Amphibalanus amphitrite]